MVVLILEDRGSVSLRLARSLESEGHRVLRAFSVAEANALREDAEVDCFVVDLNMSPEGLTIEEIEQTGDGIRTGWVWLKNYVFPGDETLRKRTIIYSAFLSEFRSVVPADDRRNIRIYEKNAPSGLKWLLNAVESIARDLQ